MRKLIKRFKEWLIRKLGGYSTPFATQRIYRPEPIELSAKLNVDRRCDFDSYDVKMQLAYEIADEIVTKKLFKLEHCTDDYTNSRVFRMRVLVVEPIERNLFRVGSDTE